MTPEPSPRSVAWRYYVCGLLLLATTINYLDRQTLAATSVRITRELDLSNEQYGRLELVFGWAFAVGASLFGWLADRTSVRWLYPAVLLLWSAMGFFTGLVETYLGLLVCRMFLGLFEAGHWPCALKTTQRILTPRERTLGNSILQSGSSIGAILTPLLVLGMLTPEPGSWRTVFQVIGLAGAGWVVLWLTALRASDFETTVVNEPISPADATDAPATEPAFWQVVCSRRFVTLLIVVVAINACWQIIRAWLLKFLVEGRGYSEDFALGFNSVYYMATDVGCIVAGLASIGLVRGGWSVHGARVAVYSVCSLLTLSSVAIHWLPAGWPLLGVLLLVGCGSLGLFPCYYSFSQELSVVHQGKVTGLLGTFAWAASSPLQWLFGWVIDATGSYDSGMMLAGVCPILGVIPLIFMWHERPEASHDVAQGGELSRH